MSLTPEKRIDRNGRVVTRHIRSSDLPLPSRVFPELTGLFGNKRGSEGIKLRMDSIRDNPRFRAMNRKERNKLLSTLHPDTMTTLDQHNIRTYDDEVELPEEIVGYCINNGSFVILNDLAAYIEDHGTFRGYTYGDLEPLTSLLGLRSGPIATLDATIHLKHYSEADAEQRKAQHAVITATRTISIEHLRFSDEADGPISRRVNGDLVRYILENPEKVERIIRVINTRRITPTGKGLEDIKAIVENEDEIGTTLSQGAL